MEVNQPNGLVTHWLWLADVTRNKCGRLAKHNQQQLICSYPAVNEDLSRNHDCASKV